MTIGAYGTSAIAANRSDATFRTLKSELTSLQGSLTTGRVSETYAGLGTGAAKSLSGRSVLATLESYSANVSDAGLRTKLLSVGVTQIGKLGAALATSLPGTYNQSPIGQTKVATSAEDALRQSLSLLNQDLDGRYLFSGRASDTEPVVSYELLMDGDAGRAGLKQLVAERKQADAGPDGLGRLALGGSGTAATVTEEAAGLPFGIKLASASATGTGLTASLAAGAPASASIAVAAQPNDGDAISIGLTLPDGSVQTLTLTATASTPGQNGFAIGATAADTATNLRAALDGAVRSTAATTLASASTVAASTAFFAGSSSNPPVRVAGPSYATATATVPGTAANTVVWYLGDDGAGSPRETAPVRIGDNATVSIGARANEAPFRSILSAFGALAADSFATTDPTSQARYSALADRVASQGGAELTKPIQVDLSVATATLGATGSRLSTAKAQLEDTIGAVEIADPNEVAAKLLATQTRLQASYQATATIARMSLVDYL